MSTVRYVSNEDEERDGNEMFVGMVKNTDDRATCNKWTQKLRVDKSNIDFKLDTGSDVNIISEQAYLRMSPIPKLERSQAVLMSYSRNEIPSIGVCQVSIRYKKRLISTSMEVVSDGHRPALQGGPDCDRLGIVRRVNALQSRSTNEQYKAYIKKTYPQLFQDNGSLPGEHTIVLKEGAKSVVHAPRRVAV